MAAVSSTGYNALYEQPYCQSCVNGQSGWLWRVPSRIRYPPSLDHLIADDGQPVDNFFVEKQQCLLTEPLNSSWAGPGDGRLFIVTSNVGLFFEPKNRRDAQFRRSPGR
jgi:hypothetical protein